MKSEKLTQSQDVLAVSDPHQIGNWRFLQFAAYLGPFSSFCISHDFSTASGAVDPRNRSPVVQLLSYVAVISDKYTIRGGGQTVAQMLANAPICQASAEVAGEPMTKFPEQPRTGQLRTKNFNLDLEQRRCTC